MAADLELLVDERRAPWGVVLACPVCLSTIGAHKGKAWCVGNQSGMDVKPKKADGGDHDPELMVRVFLTPVDLLDDAR